MDVSKAYPHKIMTAEKAVKQIKPGNRVFIGTGCGEPQHLIHAMVKDKNMHDIMIYQMLSSTLAEFVETEEFLRRFSLKLFFISWAMRKAASVGSIDYIPTYLSRIPNLFQSGRIGLDVALVQVSPPDPFGYCSLGISVDITQAGASSAKILIAQVNKNMPKTWGDSFIHVDDVDYFVLHDEPIVDTFRQLSDEENEISERIGLYVSQVVEDGATLQIGFGHLPNAILKYLDNKKDLGVHTQVVTDGLLPLLRKKSSPIKRRLLILARLWPLSAWARRRSMITLTKTRCSISALRISSITRRSSPRTTTLHPSVPPWKSTLPARSAQIHLATGFTAA